MKFETLLENSKFILTEGSVIELLARNTAISIDPHILNASLIYDEKEKLASIYREYIKVGRQFNLPLLVLAPTWRVNKERAELSGYGDAAEITGDCVDFLRNIRSEHSDYSDSICVGGLVSCRGDAYDPTEALSESDAAIFHTPQAENLIKSGVDFIIASTLPALTEAAGISRAISTVKSDIPYLISFVVNSDGTVLDGSLISDSIRVIDGTVDTPPFGYFLNCIHPLVFDSALSSDENADQSILNRIIGLQANTSRRSPSELDNLPYLDTEEPEKFADAMIAIHKKYGARILGGCCGTNPEHIMEIARKYALIYS